MKPAYWASFVLAMALIAAGCGSGRDDNEAVDPGGSASSTTTAAPQTTAEVADTTITTTTADPEVTVKARPAGPAAVVSAELAGGNGVALPDISSARGETDVPDHYTQTEFAVEGTAVAYASDTPLSTDGLLDLTETTSADYRTRIVVRRPSDPNDFNGTVIVEWLNVSGGVDAAPDYTYMRNEIIRSGYGWVGVSAQRIGVEGGAVAVAIEGVDTGAGQGLINQDPERYGDLVHPGDAYSFDIFTQVARLVRADRADGTPVLGGLTPDRLVAVGESQSAMMLTTYANGVQPLAQYFDGFLIHSRGGATAPLGEPGAGIDIAAIIGGPPTTIRTDLDVPVFVVETETDVLGVLGYYPARQSDTDLFRLWEIAGTAHADAYLISNVAELAGCSRPVNDGPQHFVIAAALHHLDTWVRFRTPPPQAEPLAVQDGVYRRDDNGIVMGGIRTPLVDVPVDVLSGEATAGDPLACLLFGSTVPIDSEELNTMYASPAAYLSAYETAADEAISKGFVLEADREELLAQARPERIG